MIPESVLNQIQERTDIVELVSAFVPLKRAGRNFKACCPFHHEKTPSFMVNPDKQIFHCFGCGVGGNVFGFLMKIEKKDFREAVETLASRCGVDLPNDSRPLTEADKRLASLTKANERALDHFRQTLLGKREGEPARLYLKKRGISDATSEAFRLGFAPDSWDALLKILKPETPEAFLDRTGLFVTKEGGGRYDRFRNRVMFPILDARGACVAFGGRVMDDSVPKYLNSPETELYVKGRHVYGLFQARKSIREKDAAIVTEGYMDVLACHQAGVTNAVASLGTALTPEQARLLKRNTRNIYILYDADKAGEAATLRGLEVFLEEGLEVKIIRLPEGHDPDSFIRERGAERFQAELEGAKTLFDYRLDGLKMQHGTATPEARSKVANEMIALLRKVQDPILQSQWLRHLASKLAEREETLAALLKAPGRTANTKAEEPKPAATKDETPVFERQLVGLMLDRPDFMPEARVEVKEEDFKHPAIRKVVKRLLEEEKAEGPAAIMNAYEDDPEISQLVASACAETEKFHDKRRAFDDCLAYLRRIRLERQRQEILKEIQAAQSARDETRNEQLLKDLTELNQGMRRANEKK